jgi:hypothetical protein
MGISSKADEKKSYCYLTARHLVDLNSPRNLRRRLKTLQSKRQTPAVQAEIARVLKWLS